MSAPVEVLISRLALDIYHVLFWFFSPLEKKPKLKE